MYQKRDLLGPIDELVMTEGELNAERWAAAKDAKHISFWNGVGIGCLFSFVTGLAILGVYLFG
jgi:hypothetical protein